MSEGTFAILIWFVRKPGSNEELDPSRMDEWGRPVSEALLRAWKPGYPSAFLPRPGDVISSRTIGEALTSHLDRPMIVSAVLHSPVPSGSEGPGDDGRPTTYVEIRQEIDKVEPNLLSSLMESGWRVQ